MLQIVSFVCIYLDREERMCCLSRVNILSSLVRTRVVIRHLALVNIEWCRAHDIDVSYLSHFSSSFAPPVISSINITHLSNSSPHISSHVIVDKRGVAHFFHRILINKRNLYQLRESWWWVWKSFFLLLFRRRQINCRSEETNQSHLMLSPLILGWSPLKHFNSLLNYIQTNE